MVRLKQYTDTDVLAAARDRLRHVFDIFDSVAVCFSGGKDSLVALHLTWEIAQERGADHVVVIFRDEELIPEQVIDFVNEYRVKPWVKMHYFAVPLASQKFILGRSFDYVQWDPSRPHIRPVPEHAIVLEPGDNRVFDQYSMDAYAGALFHGKVAFITGIRASESLMRYRASVNKLVENYITGTEAPRVHLVKPLFDWEENDIFKYLWENDLRYCPLYDSQLFAGANLRVSTPLHAESAKRFGGLRAIAPTFYQQVIDLFPEMLEQERYYGELDKKAVVARYGADLDGVAAFLDENFEDEHQLEVARAQLVRIRSLQANSPEAYPADYVLRYFMGGSFKRLLIPLGKVEQAKRRARA